MKATKRVNIPTRPTNMVTIRIILLVELKDGVMPNESPQVVYADTDSKSRDIMSWLGSEKFNKIKLNEMVKIDKRIMAKALLTDSEAIFLL